MRAHPRRVEDDAHRLPPARLRARLSAYVYGNILVLAAVGTATPHTIDNGHAVVVVLATTITTYLAHVVAHLVGEAVRSPTEDPEPELDELRDALPIISSGSAPALVMLLGAVTDLDLGLAQLIATGVIVVRLAATGPLIARLSGRPATGLARWAGIVIAVLGLAIATLKVWLLH